MTKKKAGVKPSKGARASATKKEAARDPLAALRALELDVLQPDYPAEAIDGELRERGFDPDALAASGRALAEQLLERRRHAWRAPATAELAKVREKVAGVAPTPADDRPRLLARLAKAKSDPRLAKLAASFRGKTLEEATIAELLELCDEVEKLRALLDDGDDA